MITLLFVCIVDLFKFFSWELPVCKEIMFSAWSFDSNYTVLFKQPTAFS